MPLTCPSCGNNHNFLVKTLQMHVVRLDDSRVEVNDEGRPAVIEVLCDECDPEGNAADARRPLVLPFVALGLFPVIAFGTFPFANRAFCDLAGAWKTVRSFGQFQPHRVAAKRTFLYVSHGPAW